MAAYVVGSGSLAYDSRSLSTSMRARSETWGSEAVATVVLLLASFEVPDAGLQLRIAHSQRAGEMPPSYVGHPRIGSLPLLPATSGRGPRRCT